MRRNKITILNMIFILRIIYANAAAADVSGYPPYHYIIVIL
tara:strand:+ start:3048 stop:3170 length:123 start_codon:yes stop_codon:yes gene_type:complete